MSYPRAYRVPLVKTKLHIPPLLPGLVSRPRLLERLDEGLLPGRRLVLLSAPAGFGKTTLLSEWVRASDTPTAWLSLDDLDNDPARFLAHLVAALQRIDGNTGASIPAPQSLPGVSPPADLAPALISDLECIDERFLLVLDDYHLIHARPIHDLLAFLLDHAPATLRLVLATRADPPLPLSRLRGRGQLVELRQSDLRFTTGEASTYLGQATSSALRAEYAGTLAARTEGWIAGLQMAAMSLRDRDDVSQFVAAFAGRHEHIADYMADEVLGLQPAEMQRFLLQTSILDHLCGPLCDAVCESVEAGNGQRTLQQLHARNLFIVPLDDERGWYRYHRLFADLLRQRLGHNHPEVVPELQRRASEWYEQNGLHEEAIEHALSAEDFDRAAKLVAQTAETTLMRSEIATFLRWVDALPEEKVRDRTELSLYHAAALLVSGAHPETVTDKLQVAETPGAPDLVVGGTAILRALLALWRGDARQSSALCQQALARLPEESLFLRSIAGGTLGIAHSFGGQDPQAAAATLQEAAEIGERAGSAVGAVVALCNLAELRIAEGRLHKARALYDRAAKLAMDGQGRQLPIGGMALVGMGEILREWNDLEEARRHLSAGIEQLGPAMPIWALDGHLSLARVRQAQGDVQGAQEALAAARRLAVDFDVTELDDWIVDAFRARLWIAQGSLDPATRWAQGRGLLDKRGRLTAARDDVAPLHYLQHVEHVTLARLLLVRAEPTPAMKVLDGLLADSRRLQRDGELIEIQALRSTALSQRGSPECAVDALTEALLLGEPQGYVRTFLDGGPPMAHLLHQALARGIATDYVQRLLTGFGPASRAPQPKTLEPVEQLSDREQQVLRLLATRLTNAEIAEHLYISVNTVRFHLKNIYGRLDVHSRHDAVLRAKELGLL